MQLVTYTPADYARQNVSPFAMAVAHLRNSGYSVEPSDVDGLAIVAGGLVGLGSELTMAQVVDLARQIPRFR